ncbi:MAG: hypothetical protein K0S55_902 [Clostridia bacterium]|nr:hypothetical protein [Clostridia bacterium]
MKGLNISIFTCGKSVFINREYIKGYAFKNVQLWEKYALLQKFTHVIMAVFANAWDNSVHFYEYKFYEYYIDCFEYLLPLKISD